MVIHIVGTVNGQINEGMRNVATHLAREFEKEHRVICSGLREIPRIVYRSSRADVTMIFARASRRVYSLGWLVSRLCKNTWIVLVQKPEEGFLERNRRRPLDCHYLSITEGDMAQLETLPGKRKQVFPVGIDPEKFRPVEAEQQRRLKEKYGFDPDQPLVIHVGHCSKGRGLEDLTRISGAQRMVAASGMFEDETVMKTLRQAGVKIHKGYLEHVEEVYQLYLVRNCLLEHSLFEDRDCVGRCLGEIGSAFRWGQPAVLSSHRVNYIGRLVPGNGAAGARILDELLGEVLKRWPDVRFLSSDQLAALYRMEDER